MLIKIPLNLLIKVMAKGDKKFAKKTKTFGTYHLLKDIKYVDDDNDYHKLDIYSPVLNHENGITLLYIHGGAYVYGVKEGQTIFSSFFADRGFKVITPNYRLINNSENVDFVSQVQDVFKVLEFIEENRIEFNINDDNLCLMGDSAGGHICLMVDMIYHSKELQDYFHIDHLPNVKIKCVALNSSMYDFPSLMNIAKKILKKKDILKLFSKNCFVDGYMEKLSPAYYVKNGVKTSPLFASSSYHDYFLDQTLKLKNDAKKYDLDLELLIEKSPNKKVGHIYNHFMFTDEGLKCNLAMIDFFYKHADKRE